MSAGTPQVESDISRRFPLRKFILLCGCSFVVLAVTLLLISNMLVGLNPITLPLSRPGDTPNPSKAPLILLGFQEALVYIDPYLAATYPLWVVFTIVLGFTITVVMAIVIWATKEASPLNRERLRLKHYALALLLFIAWMLLPLPFARYVIHGYG